MGHAAHVFGIAALLDARHRMLRLTADTSDPVRIDTLYTCAAKLAEVIDAVDEAADMVATTRPG